MKYKEGRSGGGWGRGGGRGTPQVSGSLEGSINHLYWKLLLSCCREVERKTISIKGIISEIQYGS